MRGGYEFGLLQNSPLTALNSAAEHGGSGLAAGRTSDRGLADDDGFLIGKANKVKQGRHTLFALLTRRRRHDEDVGSCEGEEKGVSENEGENVGENQTTHCVRTTWSPRRLSLIFSTNKLQSSLD